MNLDFYSACQDIDNGQLPSNVFDEVLAGTVSSQYKREYCVKDHEELMLICNKVLSVLKKYDCKVTKIYLACSQMIVPIFDRKESLGASITNEDIEKLAGNFSILHHRFAYDICADICVLFNESIEYTMLTSPRESNPVRQRVGTKRIECTWRIQEPSV